jgi:crotonobetainyl-CoA:carnitine CoA-transferase CaiB-like acyl-CoA transferase
MRHADLPNPLVAAYRTRDGRQIYLAGIVTEGHFENFCKTIDRNDLLDDARFATGQDRLAHRRELIDILDAVFASRNLTDWAEALRGLTTPWTVVQTAAEAAADAQVAANGFVAQVDGPDGPYPLVRSPARFDGTLPPLRAPGHGEHTEEVLLELGRTWEDIARLKTGEAVL